MFAPISLLEGLRVVEVEPALSGAVCGRMFAEMGAEVLKIDSPGPSEAAASVRCR